MVQCRFCTAEILCVSDYPTLPIPILSVFEFLIRRATTKILDMLRIIALLLCERVCSALISFPVHVVRTSTSNRGAEGLVLFNLDEHQGSRKSNT